MICVPLLSTKEEDKPLDDFPLTILVEEGVQETPYLIHHI